MPRIIPTTRLRNIGIMAHIDAGKTTCAERILFFTGRVRAPGEVHRGTTQLDHLPQERAKGITITSAATTVSWTPQSGIHEGVEHRIQLIDTPGHIDFTIEVERCLRVLDGAVFVLDAASGVECQSETVWHQAVRHGIPRLAFLNKVDKPGADVAMCLGDLRERLGARPVLLTFPGTGGLLLDALRQRGIAFDDDAGRQFHVVPGSDLSDDDRRAVDLAHARLVEACADFDDEVFEAFCRGAALSSISPIALERAMRAGTLSGGLLVVLCGSALKNRGIQQLLDAVVAYLPSPVDLPPVSGTEPGDENAIVLRPPRDDAPFTGLAFKTVSDRSAGVVTFVRIYSGTLTAGTEVRVLPRDTRERVRRMFVLHADSREEITEAHTGAIVAIAGLRSARTGDTLCAAGSPPLVLERILAPEPVIQIAIEPATADDRDRFGEAIGRMLVEDPSLQVSSHPDTGQTILAGMGQLHLEITVDRLRTDHGVSVAMGKPEVAYRETIAAPARAEYRYIKQPGGSGQYAVVTLTVAPGPRGSGITFVDETVGGVIPREMIPGVEKGVRGAASRGVFAGFPVVDVVVKLVDGAFHAKDSSPAAFEIAGSLGFQRAVRAAGAVLLEPMTAVEVTVPEDLTGDVVGDLASRRGVVKSISPRGHGVVIGARAPLGAMFDWISRLRGLTSGRGSAVAKVDGYDVVPDVLARAKLGAS